MKKLTSLILIATLIFALSLPASAVTPEENSIEPQYTNAQNANVSLTISSSGTATVQVSCFGYASVTNAKVSVYIERNNGGTWTQVSNTWTYSTGSSSIFKSYTTSISETGQYRAVARFTLVASTAEYITKTSTVTF